MNILINPSAGTLGRVLLPTVKLRLHKHVDSNTLSSSYEKSLRLTNEKQFANTRAYARYSVIAFMLTDTSNTGPTAGTLALNSDIVLLPVVRNKA